jgi:hypothetical protein
MAAGKRVRFLSGLTLFLAGIGATELPGLAQRRPPVAPDTRALMAREYLDRQGRPRPDLWRRGVEHTARMTASGGLGRSAVGGSGAPVSGLQWNPIGPQPLLVDPAPPNINVLFQGPREPGRRGQGGGLAGRDRPP